MAVNVSKEAMNVVKQARIEDLERKVADSAISVEIYRKMVDAYGDSEDRKAFAQELTKLDRLELALETVKGVE